VVNASADDDAPLTAPGEDEVLRAATAIVDAYSATDGALYFSLFAPDATFCFHTEPVRLDNRHQYEVLWDQWTAEGWRVRSCVSTGQLVQTFPGGAVFSHDVATSVETPDGVEDYRERETIVFRTESDHLVAIHEHLSPVTSATD
jgi:ketosteroid isomerase-like protein